jgi:proline-specific peptidase
VHTSLTVLPSQKIGLFVREHGEGFPILIMHGGLGADHSTMLGLLPLSDAYRLIFYDHRCNGRSEKADISTMTWDNLCADAEALRSHFAVDKWAIVGHSFGGMIALEYAIRYPQRVSHLVLLDTGGDSSYVQEKAPVALRNRGFNETAVALAKRFYKGEINDNELKKSMLTLGRAYYSNPGIGFFVREVLRGLRIRANSKAFIYGSKVLLRGWNVMDQLARISSPTLIVAGSDDFLWPPGHQRELKQRIAEAELHLLTSAGHMAHIEQSEKVIGLIRSFVPS